MCTAEYMELVAICTYDEQRSFMIILPMIVIFVKKRLIYPQKVRQVFAVENGGFRCIAAEKCTYRPKTIIISNCHRHLRKQHPIEFNILNFGKRLDDDDEVKNLLRRKRIKHAGQPDESTIVRVHRRKIIGGLIKLCTLGCQSSYGNRNITQGGGAWNFSFRKFLFDAKWLKNAWNVENWCHLKIFFLQKFTLWDLVVFSIVEGGVQNV